MSTRPKAGRKAVDDDTCIYKKAHFNSPYISIIPPFQYRALQMGIRLLLYTALKYSPASVVTPIRGTQVLFVFFLSFLVNRRIEVFTWKIFIGIVVTVLGTFLLFQ